MSKDATSQQPLPAPPPAGHDCKGSHLPNAQQPARSQALHRHNQTNAWCLPRTSQVWKLSLFRVCTAVQGFDPSC